MKTIIGETLKYSLEDLLDRQQKITKNLIESKTTENSIIEESSLQESSLEELIKLIKRAYD